MRKNDEKKILHWSWVCAERQMIKKLERLAAQGWVLESSGGYHLHLRRVQPQALAYAVDWPCRPADEVEYLAFFEAAGWTLACRENTGFYIFYAPAGTTPLHTDQTALNELRAQRLKKMLPPTVISGVLFLLLMAAMLLLPLSTFWRFALGLPGVACAWYFGVWLTTTVGLASQRHRF